MAGTQALEASRTPAFTFKPQDLIMVTTPGERFYSPTVEDEIPDADVMDTALRGVLQSLRVRRTDKGSVVTAGRQRTKRALVVNALLGIPYTGSVNAVFLAIERLKASPMGDRIVEIALKKHGAEGIMLRAFAANSGTEADEEINGVAEDEMRRGGSGCPWDVRARRAQQLIESGQPIERVAESMTDVTVPTLKRWIAKLNAGQTSAEPKKVRTASSRPKAKILKKVFRYAGSAAGLTPRERTLIYFVMGLVTEDGLLSAVPELAPPV